MSSSMTPLGSIELIAAMAVHHTKPTPRRKISTKLSNKTIRISDR